MTLKEELRLRELGNEYVIVDPGQDMVDMSQVYTLNETAAFLWKALQRTEFSEEDVIALLMASYEVSREEAETDTRRLLSEFRTHGLLTD